MKTWNSNQTGKKLIILGITAAAFSCGLVQADEDYEKEDGAVSSVEDQWGENDWQGEAYDAWVDGKLEASFLLNTELNNFRIDTDVQDGVVTLEGEVSSEDEKVLAQEIAQNIEGVKEVNNMLSIDAGS